MARVEPWEPLAWRLMAVTHCPVHWRPLIGRCPHCLHPQPVLSERVPIGHCRRCGRVLHGGSEPLDSSSADMVHVWNEETRFALCRSIALARVRSPCGGPPRRCSTGHAKAAAGIVSPWRLGLSRRNFTVCSTRALPSPRESVDFCLHLGVDPSGLLFGDGAPNGAPPWPRPYGSSGVRLVSRITLAPTCR